MSDTLLKVDRVSKSFGGFAALSEVSVAVKEGERFGLIGPNGSGKTTLINCVSGALRNDGGSIAFSGEEISRLPAYQRTRRGIARTFQVPRPFSSMSVLENLIVPLEFVAHRHSLHKADTRAEAMAGLAGAEVDEVLAILFKLNEAGITIIMIEHIMQAVMRFSQRVICLDAGRIICEGTPTAIVANLDVQRAYLGA
jgi:branched-chain amino acid transport system ATP-binding protein